MRARSQPRWPWLLVGLLVLQLAGLFYGLSWHVGRPLGGLMPHRGGPSDLRVYGMPTSEQALAVGYRGTLELLRVNGRSVCETPSGPRCGVDWARSLIDTRPGHKNRFVVRVQPDDQQHELELTAGPGEFKAVLSWAFYGLVMLSLGLVYVVTGLVVWRRRPADPASLPFLMLVLGIASALAGAWYVDTATLVLQAAVSLSSSLVVSLLFLFAHSFSTQSDASTTLRFRFQFIFGVALGATEGAGELLSALGAWSLRPWVGAFTPLLGLAAALSLALSLHTMWRAARPPSPLYQRRRARVLALAIAFGFTYPTLWLIYQERLFEAGYERAAFWGLVVSFASMPLLIGYAMVRHRMFDLRIVVRQGLVYTALSALLALAYVAVVVGAYRLAGNAESTAAPVVAAVAVALLFGVARVRVERWIDAVVFRGRAIFRRAIEGSGKALAEARHVADVAPALRPALIEALQLLRAYVVERHPDGLRVQCHTVGNLPDPETGSVPAAPPMEASLEDGPALRHLFQRRAIVMSVDAAVPAEEDGSLWERYGLEASVPFGMLDDSEPVGLLLLGPKQSGRPFDPEDLRLVELLGSQVALALSSARAFERLAESGAVLLSLTQGIVHEANTPLGALQSSVDTLERALSQLATEGEGEGERHARARRGARLSIETVRKSGARLTSLIADLKAYVNLEETERAALDLRLCLREAVAAARRESGHAIELRCPEEPALVDGFPTKLRHVFRGIVDNAISATQDREAVRVALSRSDAEVIVTVED